MRACRRLQQMLDRGHRSGQATALGRRKFASIAPTSTCELRSSSVWPAAPSASAQADIACDPTRAAWRVIKPFSSKLWTIRLR